MLSATSRQHYQGKAFPSHSPLVYLFLSRCQNLASSTERLSFALMLGRHPVPACSLSLPVSAGILYTRLPACQEMLSLVSTPPPLPPPAGESPVLGLLQDPGVRQSRPFSPRRSIASAPQRTMKCTTGKEEPCRRSGGQPSGVCTIHLLFQVTEETRGKPARFWFWLGQSSFRCSIQGASRETVWTRD